LISQIKTVIFEISQGALSMAEMIENYPLLILLGCILIVLIIAVAAILLKFGKRRHGSQAPIKPAERMFVAIETEPIDQNEAFLSLDQQIINSAEGLSSDIKERLINKGAKVLNLIVDIYDSCSPAVQNEIKQIIHENHLMEEYALHLKEDEYTIGTLVQAWACFPSDTVLMSYVEQLASTDEESRMYAVRLLSAMQEPKVLPHLVMTLARPDRFTPARTAEVFVSMPERSAKLLAYILPEINDNQKELVLSIIAQTKASYAAENVVKCLSHRNVAIRKAAVLALGSSGRTTVVPDLMVAALDKKWEVRAAAAQALGMIGDSRSLPTLYSLSNDTEGWVAAAAKEALRNLGV